MIFFFVIDRLGKLLVACRDELVYSILQLAVCVAPPDLTLYVMYTF